MAIPVAPNNAPPVFGLCGVQHQSWRTATQQTEYANTKAAQRTAAGIIGADSVWTRLKHLLGM